MTKSKGMKVLRWSWMIQTVVLFIVSIAVTFWPDEGILVERWMKVMPLLTGITTAEGLIAFGGSAIKRGQNGKDS